MSPRSMGAAGAAALVLLALAPAAASAVTKKLIESGWDEPDAAFMRSHIAQMEATPFDGCVYHLEYRKPDGSEGNFTWDAWGRRAFTREELMPAVRDLEATPFRRFQHNFLRFNTSPADLDWFDDHSAILNNARLAGWAAKTGRSKGIWLDPEQYHGKLFNYRAQRDAGTRSFEEYARQVRLRGRQVMEAFQEGYPDLTLFISFGYPMTWRSSAHGRWRLADSQYGLLAAFLDGLVEGTHGQARIVDGHELTYPIREPWEIPAAYREMRETVLPVVADPARYRSVVSCAFGIWMDYDWKKNGWNVGRTTKNYRPPRTFQLVLSKALETTDEYVWVYTEQPRWWTAAGKMEKLPNAYVTALRRARAAHIRDAPR